MSAFKTILVPIDTVASVEVALPAALVLARSFAAHLTALHIRPDPGSVMPLITEGMSASVAEEMVKAAESEGRLRAAAVRQAFEGWCARQAVPQMPDPPSGGRLPDEASITWREEAGSPEELVPLLGRIHDLIVQPRPQRSGDEALVMTINAALIESGRPVLLVPRRDHVSVGHRVVVAWNHSIEAARAVSAALPLLTAAQTVSIVLSHRDQHAVPKELATYLAWHGIVADIRPVGAEGTRFGQALLNEATARYADLIVMGAYTHSRLRQLVFGGVTRHVLTHAEVPVLLCH